MKEPSLKPRLVIGLFLLLLLSIGAGLSARATGISLPHPVPSFSQNYTLGPDAWGNATLGSDGCPDSFRVSGCLVTAFASVLAYYGIEVSVPAAQSFTGRPATGMDPGILNDWLRAHGGFGRCGGDAYGSCCLEWSRLPAGIELSFYTNRSDVGLNPVAEVVIDHALRQGYPIVAGVHWGASCNGSGGQTEDCHWIVLTGKAGDTYTILDPYNPDPTSPRGVKTTLDDGTRGSYIIDRFVVVTGTIPAEGGETPKIDHVPASEEGTSSPSLLDSIAVLVLLLAALTAIVFATR